MTVPPTGTASELLASALRAAAVDAVYGDPPDGIVATPVPSSDLAGLLATCHRRLVGRRAVVAGDRQLRAPGPDPVRLVVTSPSDIAALPPVLAAAHDRGFVVDLDIDLATPAPGLWPEPVPPSDRWLEPADDVAGRIASAASPLVLAGPGVVAAAAVPGLHALASAGRLGVLNTWGAKGVFDWRSRHHLATAGLQALDFELAGLPGADLVIAVGVDLDESPAERWLHAGAVTVDPRALSPLAQQLDRVGPWLPVPELRHRLAAVTQAGWAAAGAPLAPTAATRNYGAVLGDGGRIAADAGLAGYWVARTFSTTEVGSAQVPAVAIPGFAAAVALVSRLLAPARQVLAVIDGAPSDMTRRLLELADSLGRGFAVEAWSVDGDALDASAHLDRLGRLAVAQRSEVVTVATAAWQLDHIIEAAGPVVAWGGLPSPAV